jgi:hypothetical protein
MTDLVDHALRLAARGYVCVPLSKGGRHLDLPVMGFDPVHLRSCAKDLKELAFTSIAYRYAQQPPDAATIRQWFEGHSGNIGILGGAGDLVILDFDRSDIFERWRATLSKLCASTPIERTPNGFHVFIRCPGARTSTSLHIGFRRAGHIKGLGGYAVTFPSTLADGARYGWLPKQSPFEIEPHPVADLGTLGIRPVSPLKEHYDRLLGRGRFEPE